MLAIENASHLESIFHACLECGRPDWAKVVFNILKEYGPEMPKTYRLKALLLNSEGKTREAYQVLYSILKTAPSDSQTWKVLISLKNVVFNIKENNRPMTI